MVARIRRWLGLHRPPPVLPADLRDDDPEVVRARRRLEASTRLVSIHSGKSARALRKLNRLLALRARAIANISTAEAALATMDKARRDDQ